MARDRLAGLRKDKQGETSATTSGAGSGDASNIPMRDLLNMEDFMTSIDEVRTQIEQLRRSTTLLRDSHARALAASSSATVGPEQLGTADAQRLSQETGALANEVRGRIVGLAGDNRRAGGGGEGFEARKKQLEGVQSAFKGALEELFQVEKEARGKARERIERQYRMVKPTATQEEMDEALAGSVHGRQVFAEALTTARRTGARTAFTESVYRNEELREIERTMGECAQLMNDMANLTLEQDFAVEQIEADATRVHEDVAAGHRQVTLGTKFARAARKKRWWGFSLLVVIGIVLAIVLAVTLS